MRINYNEIKAGDRVQIANGDWVTVREFHQYQDEMSIEPYIYYDINRSGIGVSHITAHKPAEAKTEAEGLTSPTPAHEAQPVGDRPRDCQHGHDDVCLMAQFDGVCCPDESCDIDDGIRKPPEAATQPVWEWVTEEELMAAIAGFGMDEFDKATESLNTLLAEKYGHRTYNGEPASEWMPIQDAPKGGGAKLVSDPKWVDPPKILASFPDGDMAIIYWDYYYDVGGRGYTGEQAWVLQEGDLAADVYGNPTNWMPLPPAPKGGAE